jgi:hypothetical protein
LQRSAGAAARKSEESGLNNRASIPHGRDEVAMARHDPQFGELVDLPPALEQRREFTRILGPEPLPGLYDK